MKVVEGGKEVEYDKTKDLDKRVIKFTASWCRPCKRVHSQFVDLAGKCDSVDFLVCDIDDDSSSALFKEYGVKSLPTFVFATGERRGDGITWTEHRHLRVEGSDAKAIEASVKAHA